MKWDDARDDDLAPEFDSKGPDASLLPWEVLPKEWKPEDRDEESGSMALLTS